MKKLIQFGLILIVVLGAVISGCSKKETPTTPEEPADTPTEVSTMTPTITATATASLDGYEPDDFAQCSFPEHLSF